MCFCSRRAYNIENMVDIKNFKNFIMHQFVDFKYRIWQYHDWIFFNPTIFSMITDACIAENIRCDVTSFVSMAADLLVGNL